MAKKITLESFKDRFTKKLILKDSDNIPVSEIEIGITTDKTGSPIIHFCCDNEEIFENPNSYELDLFELLRIAAEEYLDGNYSDRDHPVKSYKHLAHVLRHYANLMELQAAENEEMNRLQEQTRLTA